MTLHEPRKYGIQLWTVSFKCYFINRSDRMCNSDIWHVVIIVVPFYNNVAWWCDSHLRLIHNNIDESVFWVWISKYIVTRLFYFDILYWVTELLCFMTYLKSNMGYDHTLSCPIPFCIYTFPLNSHSELFHWNLLL